MDHRALMSHHLKVGLDPGHGDSAQDRSHLLHPAEVEEARHSSFQFQREQRVCIQQ